MYRLPKENEWEYACRGGPGDVVNQTFDYYFEKPTNELLPGQANFGSAFKRTCKVGLYKPNRLGLYDMHGNVSEWCEDIYRANAKTPQRVARGGGWNQPVVGCRAFDRASVMPDARLNSVGLRLARVPVGKEILKVAATEEKEPAVDVNLPAPFKNDLGMEFVMIPKGKSWLGRYLDRPVREVEVIYDFYLGKYEVTQDEWEKVTGSNPSEFKAVVGVSKEDQKRFPVDGVTWDDAQAFIKQLNQKVKEAGWVYRLPKEDE